MVLVRIPGDLPMIVGNVAAGGVTMMDVVLGGAMGLVLAGLLTGQPKPKKIKITSKIVEEPAVEVVEAKSAKGSKKK